MTCNRGEQAVTVHTNSVLSLKLCFRHKKQNDNQIRTRLIYYSLRLGWCRTGMYCLSRTLVCVVFLFFHYIFSHIYVVAMNISYPSCLMLTFFLSHTPCVKEVFPKTFVWLPTNHYQAMFSAGSLGAPSGCQGEEALLQEDLSSATCSNLSGQDNPLLD